MSIPKLVTTGDEKRAQKGEVACNNNGQGTMGQTPHLDPFLLPIAFEIVEQLIKTQTCRNPPDSILRFGGNKSVIFVSS